MRLWIKSTPPLIIRKSYAESITELMEWIEELIADTKKEYAKKKKKFPPKKDFDIFKKCFVLLSVDTEKNPYVVEALGVDVLSKAESERARNKFTHLWKEWDKVANKPKKKLGRKKKIQTVLANPKPRSKKNSLNGKPRC